MKGTSSILILSPWPSIYSMAGGGTPVAIDLLESLLAAGYQVDFVSPNVRRRRPWFPTHDRLRVHRYHAPRLRVNGYAGRWISWFERTLRLMACGLRVAHRHGRPQVVYAFSSLTIPAAVVCVEQFLRRPTIGALFGTVLYPSLVKWLGLLYHFEETIAFKAPVDRLIILNDGTRGDEVARMAWSP